MSPAIDRLRSSPLAAAAVTICAAHVAAALALGRSGLGSLASNVLQLLASLLSAGLCFRASRRSLRFGRRMWTLVASAFVIWSLGQATYIYNENWLGVAVPQPSWTHFLFRLYGAPWIMALLLVQDEGEENGADWQQILDFAQVGILFLFFYFDLYFVPGREGQGLTGLDLWGFFDLSDVENWGLLAAFAARASLSRRLEERAVSAHLIPYLACYAASSTLANYLYMFRLPAVGTWPDVPFTISLTLASLLAIDWRPEQEVPAPPLESPSATAVYWAPAILPLLTLALAAAVAHLAPRVAFVAVFGSMACFGARLIITLYRRQRLVEALRISETRYANLIQMAPDPILTHAGGLITFANPAAALTLGLSDPRELVGRHLTEFAPPEYRSQVASELAGLGSTPVAKRWTVLRPDGGRIPLDAVGMGLPPAAGDSGPPSRLVIARDVTAIVEAAAERETLIRNLEAKNAELERFTYTASHDLRSPLITVNGFLSHIEEAALKGDLPALQADLERIRRATRKMDTLLRDLLELSRIGHVTAPAEPIPFEALCREALEAVRGRLQRGAVSVDLEPNLPIVLGDRARLVEALQNLLDNAAKFMGPQAAPLINIGRLDRQGESVFYVKDNGIGIDPRHQQAIFGLFDKLDPKAEGTGIGLALAKRIIESHGGRLWVESEGEGTGATFLFTLPLAPDPAGPPLQASPP